MTRVLGFAAGLILVGCDRPAEGMRRERPVPVVGVVAARRMDVPLITETIGTTRSLEEVSIRARVRGFLRDGPRGAGDEAPPATPSADPPENSNEGGRVTVREGQQVQAGDLLFVIEEDTYQADLAAAEARELEAKAALEKAKNSKAREVATAQVAIDQALLALARIEERRQQILLGRNAASQQDVDRAAAEREKDVAQVEADRANLEQTRVDYQVNIQSAEASLKAAQAQVEQARINLGYCRMVSPIDGRLGEAKVKVGNLVGPTTGADFTELTTVQQLDPMGVDVQVPSRYLSRATGLVRQGLDLQLTRTEERGPQPYPYPARVFFIDNRIDPTTSTFLVKASVPNPQQTLLPGEYVQIEVRIGEQAGAVVVPEQAVIETQAGPTVYVVNDQNVVAAVQVVSTDYTYQGLRVIDSGLEPGQKVVVEGLQMVRPGVTVKLEEVSRRGPENAEEENRGTETTHRAASSH